MSHESTQSKTWSKDKPALPRKDSIIRDEDGSPTAAYVLPEGHTVPSKTGLGV